MISVPYNRAKVLRWSAAVCLVAGARWYTAAYRPVAADLAAREASLQQRESRVNAARAASVEVGAAGLDSLLARFRADSARLQARVPVASDAAAASGHIKEAISEIARRAGVRVARGEPLPGGVAGEFQSIGYVMTLVGRYEDIGFVLAEIESLQRLTRIDRVALHAVPDSLVRRAMPYGTTSGAGLPAADSAGLASGLAEAGERPFSAAAVVQVRWFTQAAVPRLTAPTPASWDSVPSSFAPTSP